MDDQSSNTVTAAREVVPPSEAQHHAQVASLAGEVEKQALAITNGEKVSAGFDELIAGTPRTARVEIIDP